MPAFPDGLFLLDLQALYEPAEELRIQLSQFCSAPGPLKSAVVQALAQQNVAVPGEVQRLDPVRPSSTKQEQTIFIQLGPILPHHDLSQAVYPAVKIRIAAGNVVILYPVQVNHGGEVRSVKLLLPSGLHCPAA